MHLPLPLMIMVAISRPSSAGSIMCSMAHWIGPGRFSTIFLMLGVSMLRVSRVVSSPPCCSVSRDSIGAVPLYSTSPLSRFSITVAIVHWRCMVSDVSAVGR